MSHRVLFPDGPSGRRLRERVRLPGRAGATALQLKLVPAPAEVQWPWRPARRRVSAFRISLAGQPSRFSGGLSSQDLMLEVGEVVTVLERMLRNLQMLRSRLAQPPRPFVTLECVAKLSSLRASDSDREQVAERLRCATAEGRLTADELEERLEALFASRTHGELDALEADLRLSRPRVPVARWAGAVTGTLMLALLGRLAVRRGHSDDPALAGAEHPGQVRFPGLLADPGPGLTVTASLVRLSCGFAGVRGSPLGADAPEGHLRGLNDAGAALRPECPDPGQALPWRELRAYRAVAAEFMETDRRGQP